MPIITVQMTPQSNETKAEMIRVITTELSRVTALPQDAFRVIIQDIPAENIGIGGKTLSRIREESK